MKAMIVVLALSVSLLLMPACQREPEKAPETLPERPPAAGTASGLCSMCSKPLTGHERTLYYLTYEDGTRRTACCAHCGIVFEKKMRARGESELKRAWTFDYSTGKGIDGRLAFYAKDSDVIPCCVPSIIAFGTRERAEGFQKEHGGKLYSYEEVINLPIEELMAPEKLKAMREKGEL